MVSRNGGIRVHDRSVVFIIRSRLKIANKDMERIRLSFVFQIAKNIPACEFHLSFYYVKNIVYI